MWTLKQGRPTLINPGEQTGVLWLEPKDMPTEFCGGVLFVDSGGVPFSVKVQWGGGAVLFPDYWSSIDGTRMVCLIPASDAFYCEAFNAGQTPQVFHAWLSRDVRVWGGMKLPGASDPVFAMGTELVLRPVEAGEGVPPFAEGDEPAAPPVDQGGAFQVTSGGNEWSPLTVDSGAAI